MGGCWSQPSDTARRRICLVKHREEAIELRDFKTRIKVYRFEIRMYRVGLAVPQISLGIREDLFHKGSHVKCVRKVSNTS